MANPDNTASLTGFKALSFDCYGTLISWEAPMLLALHPLLALLPPSHAYTQTPHLALLHLTALSDALERQHPTRLYNTILTDALRQLATELAVDPDRLTAAEYNALGSGPGAWPAFADTVAALRVLKRHYKLVILSNVDRANMARTVAGALGGVEWDAVYTAEEIGSYKPDRRNFEYLFRRVEEELGVDVGGGELLHVARSLTVDHSAAKAMGFRSCWISRGGDVKEGEGVGGDLERMLEEGKVSFQWRFDTLGDFAREVERQFGEKEGAGN